MTVHEKIHVLTRAKTRVELTETLRRTRSEYEGNKNEKRQQEEESSQALPEVDIDDVGCVGSCSCSNVVQTMLRWAPHLCVLERTAIGES